MVMSFWSVVVELPARTAGSKGEWRRVDRGFGSREAAVGFAMDYIDEWSGCRARVLECEVDPWNPVMTDRPVIEVMPEDGVGTDARAFRILFLQGGAR